MGKEHTSALIGQNSVNPTGSKLYLKNNPHILRVGLYAYRLQPAVLWSL